jgi:sulfur carrier protein
MNEMAVITVNGELQTIPSETITVAELLSLNKVEMPDMVSVQCNGEFLDRQLFETATVKHADEVDFLYFMGGGTVR